MKPAVPTNNVSGEIQPQVALIHKVHLPFGQLLVRGDKF